MASQNTFEGTENDHMGRRKLLTNLVDGLIDPALKHPLLLKLGKIRTITQLVKLTADKSASLRHMVKHSKDYAGV